MNGHRKSIKAAGVDAVNAPDGPRAQNRMGAIAVSVLMQQRVGIEPVLHYCCRDTTSRACTPTSSAAPPSAPR